MSEKKFFELILSIKRKCQSREDIIQEELGLSQAEFNGLLVLNGNEEIPGLNFAERMGLSPSRSSRVLNKLVTNGYVNTTSKPEDRRSVAISLTKNGRNMKDKIYNRMQECETRICSGMDQCRIDEIKESLQLLEEVL